MSQSSNGSMKPAHLKVDSTRKKIATLEKKIGQEKVKLARLRAKAPLQEVKNYQFLADSGKSVSLADLFGSKKELILIHNMGVSCPHCTLWADGFNGLSAHLENRAGFVLESPDRVRTLSAFKKKRGWKYKTVSSHGSSFRKDLGYADKNGDPFPGVSTFVKKNGKIYRYADAIFGPGDNFCAMWDLLDLLPGKNLDWSPKFFY